MKRDFNGTQFLIETINLGPEVEMVIDLSCGL